MRTTEAREHEQSAAAPATRAAAAPTPVAHVLRLQASAGNVAVRSLLSRQEAAVAPSRPMVRRGSRGPAVSDVQSRLNTANPPAAPPLAVDGIFGPLTHQATVDFQNAAQLVPDGIVGPLTHAALDARQGPGPAPPPTPPTPQGALTPEQEAAALAFNATYDQQSVRMIQQQVAVPVNGVMDAATVQAVARFQGQHNLPATGQVDEATLNPIIADRVVILMHDHAIHLVVDLNDLDITTDTLSVHFVSTQTAPSAVKFESGGVRVITLGPPAFANAAVLRQEIETQLQAVPPAPNQPGPAPTVLEPMDANIVGLLNASKLADTRSVRIIQGLLGAPIDGVWTGELVQRVAGFQQVNGIPANGLIEDQRTLPAMVERLRANNENDAILHLIVDFYDFASNGNLISVYFDPTMGTGRVAFAGVRRDPEQAGSIQVGPEGMNQPFEGIVHTVAHEMEHIRQLTGGPEASATREFLAHAIGVMAEGIPEESVEDHDQMTDPRRPFGFANNARRCVNEWNRMPAADQQQHRERFIQAHDKVFQRIPPGSPHAVIHARLLERWTEARNRLP